MVVRVYVAMMHEYQRVHYRTYSNTRAQTMVYLIYNIITNLQHHILEINGVLSWLFY